MQTSNNHVQSTRYKRRLALHSKAADDNDFLRAYNVGTRPHIKTPVWKDAVDKGEAAWPGQLDMDRWERIHKSGGTRWKETFGRLCVGTINLVLKALQDCRDAYSLQDFGESGQIDSGSKPVDLRNKVADHRITSKNQLMVLILTKHGDKILCSDCGLPRKWLKTTATEDEILEANE